MIIDSIATALDTLYDTATFSDVGEDYDLAESENQRVISESLYRHFGETNVARKEAGVLTYPGLMFEAVHKANAETDPALKADALLELAATALSFAASVERQTDAFNDEEKPKAKAKGVE